MPEHLLNSDPFWRKSGFWVALIGTLEGLVLVVPDWAPWIKFLIGTCLVWGAFFTAAVIRPSVSVVRVDAESSEVLALLRRQEREIASLKAIHRSQE